jgi:hypothetical protein
LKDRFGEWVREKPGRAQRLTDDYNSNQNQPNTAQIRERQPQELVRLNEK